MIVLLHFFHLGFSPLSLALLFLLYELVGVITNLIGGWVTSFYGIKRMLSLGVLLQIFGLCLLSFYTSSWGLYSSIIWIMIAQGISGIAKDISKTSSKSAVKIVSGDGNGLLFKWVSWFTGLKNISKGLGFFFGSLLIEIIGFHYSLYTLILLLSLCLFSLILLDFLFRVSGQSSAHPLSIEVSLVPCALCLLRLILLYYTQGVQKSTPNYQKKMKKK